MKAFHKELARECAERELFKETFRAAVEREKARIREAYARSFWRRVFPYTIKITRRES